MRTLFAGPWVGELGWELFGWQSYIRAIATQFNRIIISSRPGHEVLYEDFMHTYIPVHPEGTQTSGHVCVGFDYDDAHKPYITEERDLWIGPHQFFRGIQDFIRFGYPSEDSSFDVILHARSTDKVQSASRNWPRAHWQTLAQRLLARGLTVACCGTPQAAIHLDGTRDLRGIPLKQLADTMASSRVTIGPSSGPLHLASLCRCPHLVWTDNSFQEPIQGTNRDRYERLWNPHRTRVGVVDAHGWQPPLEVIDAALMAFLEEAASPR